MAVRLFYSLVTNAWNVVKKEKENKFIAKYQKILSLVKKQKKKAKNALLKKKEEKMGAY